MGLEIFFMRILNNYNEREWQLYLHLLPAEKQQLIANYVDPVDRQRSLLADLLARHVIADRLNVPIRKVKFQTTKFGKPELMNDSGVFFNITHSGSWIGVALDHQSVGIDIEQVLPIDLDIAERFFSKSEVADLLSMPQFHQLDYFYQLWTLKESYLKEEGSGLSRPLNTFAIRFLKDSFRLLEGEEWSKRVFFQTYALESGYKCSVCARHNRFPEKTSFLSEPAFLQTLSRTDN
ncbi:4'-phosphopantetheinyl transferase superfamily protein [Paenibacillus sp. FSL R5-0527]|uniref:4'-phosphopantetheinyl transferase family protein n=1 Tax=Paenibacillus sp. FSL R5-0527 TaxID=2975321 RepID=UPI0026D07624